jgi:lupus La protein
MLIFVESFSRMSDIKDEPTEAVTNPTTDGPKTENGDSNTAAVDSKPEQGNGAEEAKKTPEKSHHNGPRTYENGMLKTSASADANPKRNSKYDPSVLRTTDNPKEIRGQVDSSSYLYLTCH